MKPHPSNTVNFAECLVHAICNKELIEQFDRLHGTNLLRRGAPFDVQIDAAVGLRDRDLCRFILFVDEVVWRRLPTDARRLDDTYLFVEAIRRHVDNGA